MKHLFIINPAAGSRNRTDDYSKVIHKICKARNLSYEIRVSTAPGECTRIAREACLSGQELRVYACGGDGTLNEVAAGVMGFHNVAVTVFSGGSGNDFVKLFDDPKAFFDLHRLLDADEVAFDLIHCNDDVSLNICSVGLDARIGTDVSNYKRIPLLQGFRAYVASTVVNVVKGIAEHYTVEVGGETIDGEFTMICACNGRFYGGGFNPVPTADPTDGKMDVLLVDKVTLGQVPLVVGKYKDGRYPELSHLIRHLQTDSITIHCDKPTPINLDGELRMYKDVKLSIAEEKIRFFYPKGLTWQTKQKESV